MHNRIKEEEKNMVFKNEEMQKDKNFIKIIF